MSITIVKGHLIIVIDIVLLLFIVCDAKFDGDHGRNRICIRTVSDGGVSLATSFTGKWLMTPFCCCLVPITIRYVLSGLSVSLLDSIQVRRSVRQSPKVETDYCAFDCDSDM